jgi:hypothetical protein
VVIENVPQLSFSATTGAILPPAGASFTFGSRLRLPSFELIAPISGRRLMNIFHRAKQSVRFIQQFWSQPWVKRLVRIFATLHLFD